ncbi:uncharacterized protein METZ01_LOCUS443809, partial [marine metagenome]
FAPNPTCRQTPNNYSIEDVIDFDSPNKLTG